MLMRKDGEKNKEEKINLISNIGLYFGLPINIDFFLYSLYYFCNYYDITVLPVDNLIQPLQPNLPDLVAGRHSVLELSVL